MLFFWLLVFDWGSMKHNDEWPDTGFPTDIFCQARGSCATESCIARLPSLSKVICYEAFRNAARCVRRNGVERSRKCDRETDMSRCWAGVNFAKHSVKTKRVFAHRVTDSGSDHSYHCGDRHPKPASG